MKANPAADNAALRAQFGAPANLGLNDYGWLRVFADPTYADAFDRDGYFFITAAELKRISGREPRLMAKHDWSEARPWIFKDRDLSMLAVRRDTYLVGRFNLYADFPELTGPVREKSTPVGIESLDFGAITSEATALNAAGIAGIFEDFLGCGTLQATVSGRMSSQSIALNLGGLAVDVERAQMEIDAGLESPELLCLVEAKNSINDDFNIRQLYYPWARFSAQMSKPVVPVYLVYSNGIFHLYRFEFVDAQDPRSIRFVDGARYTLTPNRLDEAALRDILATTTPGPEPEGVPFPQADSFERVINLCELAAEAPLSMDDIWNHYGFVERQARYYSDAAKYLGFMERTADGFTLTAAGQAIFERADRNARNRAIITALAQRATFHSVLRDSLACGCVVGKEAVFYAMTASAVRGSRGDIVGPTTRMRRASTARAWVEWVWRTIHEPQVDLEV